MTDHDDAVLLELVDREPLFHRTEFAAGRDRFEAMTASDFWEVGASGKVYNRDFVWETLNARYAEGEPDEWETSEFKLRPLSSGVYLLTYLLRQGARITRRATVWERAETQWRVVYHQGTHVGPC